jgi:hypothetical protein
LWKICGWDKQLTLSGGEERGQTGRGVVLFGKNSAGY